MTRVRRTTYAMAVLIQPAQRVTTTMGRAIKASLQIPHVAVPVRGQPQRCELGPALPVLTKLFKATHAGNGFSRQDAVVHRHRCPTGDRAAQPAPGPAAARVGPTGWPRLACSAGLPLGACGSSQRGHDSGKALLGRSLLRNWLGRWRVTRRSSLLGDYQRLRLLLGGLQGLPAPAAPLAQALLGVAGSLALTVGGPALPALAIGPESVPLDVQSYALVPCPVGVPKDAKCLEVTAAAEGKASKPAFNSEVFGKVRFAETGESALYGRRSVSPAC